MKNELNYSIRPFKIDDQEEVIALWKLCRLKMLNVQDELLGANPSGG